ncbi:neurexin-4-like isoform X2 [Ornithodoros turicata]|uniref:neurexin-4-like isoform X2 n=1 Tax=Ornithodoros turicata TaxID=34597 RepID=UPI00313908CE
MTVVLYIPLLTVLLRGLGVTADCYQPLLQDAKLSASSTLSRDRDAEKARINSQAAWTARWHNFNQHLTVQLSQLTRVKAIGTKGRAHSAEFVTEYQIEYSEDGEGWNFYKASDGLPKLFDGNRNGDTEVVNTFDTPIIAQFIRINPSRWRDRISLRLELYGCDYVAEALNFDGQAYVAMELRWRPITSVEDSIRFRFRTNHADGVLLYSRGAQRDFIVLQLIRDRLMLTIDLGGEGIVTNVTCGSLLDDNLWHDVSIWRKRQELTFTVDRVVVHRHIRGDSFQLDLNRELYIGGLPNFNQVGVAVVANFTGCIENLYLNDTDIIGWVKRDEIAHTFNKVGHVLYSCQFEQVIPVTFVTPDSVMKVNGYMQRQMNCSLDFRTFSLRGLLLYNKFSVDGYVKLFLDDGILKIEVEGKDTPVVTISPFDERLNDGRWHQTTLVLQKNRIELHVDGHPSITTRLFSLETGSEYLVGGGVQGMRGFIGCMRFLYIEGHYINVLNVPPDRYEGNIVFDACQMVDRCTPNPCEHGGSCGQTATEFFCNCAGTGYTGAVCHLSRHPLACEEYRMQNPKESTASIMVDVDGSGPLAPFPVECIFYPNNRTETLVHHQNEHATDVKGFRDPGSFIRDVVYNAPLEQMVQLVNRSSSCRQRLIYECFNARLFDAGIQDIGTDKFTPYGWWVSRSNQRMDYWGGSIPGSRKCRCGLYGTCKDTNRWCNCDAGLEEWLSDGGELTNRDYLPVRQLRFGDTGSIADSKRARYTLGALQCEGDSLFDHVVTFRYADATMDIYDYDLRHTGDIYFQFKTTIENGVLVHARGPADHIKVLLSGGDQIQLSYKTASGPHGVSVETSYKLNNNEWHIVHIERNKKEARILVDGAQSANVREKPGRAHALNLTSPLVIGATVDYKEGFVGCLRGLMVNGKVVDLLSAVRQGLYGISEGCVGKCASAPCLNGGFCMEGYSDYTCDCQWTPFKGPICADEIGVNLRSDYYVRYDFETTLSTLEEYIRVGFTTTEHHGMIFGVSSRTGEYLNLMMSTSGHLRLVFDFGFERQEITVKNENFALGQIHDIQIKRSHNGERLTIFVDNYEPQVHTFNIRGKADAQFNELKSIYVGRNETMGTGEGFVGCISRVQFDDHMPLRRYFQESRRANVFAHPEGQVREDTCGIEPVTYPPPSVETRPPPTLPYGMYRQPRYSSYATDSAILGGVLAALLAALVIMAIIIGRYVSRHKGEYLTHEDMGAKDATDADTAVVHGVRGHDVQKKKEWFI